MGRDEISTQNAKWDRAFSCKKCNQILTVKECKMDSKRISVKGECVGKRHKYKLELDYDDQDDWEDYWIRGVRTCEKCGDHMTHEIDDHSFHKHEVKFKMICRRHGGRKRYIKSSHKYQYKSLTDLLEPV